MSVLKNKKIVVGVGGGISAYRTLELIRLLKKAEAHVQVIATPNALQFIGAVSFEALSARACLSDALCVREGSIAHIELAHWADAVVVAPLTCDLLAKMANGFADVLLLQMLLSYRGPLVLAPAMESMMWAHPATQANAALLAKRGCVWAGPSDGLLASGRSGMGRMAEPEEIKDRLEAALLPQDYRGKTVLVTAGPTCEDLDPVRFISNRSSGRMGIAITQALLKRGAQVRLVHGPLHVKVPQWKSLTSTPVRSALQMFDAVMDNLEGCDIVVMAAAVADFAPPTTLLHKLKKSQAPQIAWCATKDILKSLGQLSSRPFLVGFAAESDNLEQEAKRKCREKNCDLLCANLIVGEDSAFEGLYNSLLLAHPNGSCVRLERTSKLNLAHALLDHIVQLRTQAGALELEVC